MACASSSCEDEDNVQSSHSSFSTLDALNHHDNDNDNNNNEFSLSDYISSNAISWLVHTLIQLNDILQYCRQMDIIVSIVKQINSILIKGGGGEEEYILLTEDGLVTWLLASLAAFIVYVLIFGTNHFGKRRRLVEDLKVSQAQVHYLQEKLMVARSEEKTSSSSSSSSVSRQKQRMGGKVEEEKREVRIFLDGAFDMMHYGHMNAFRLGRSLGTHLIVGINSDESITKCKGALPLMNDQERLTMVQGCKFVDEVVPGCPYVMNEEYLAYVISKFRVDYVVHGDDPCIVDGKDVYESAKKAGKFQSIPRTEGVSTTDIVGRMLVMTKEHHYKRKEGQAATHNNNNNNNNENGRGSHSLGQLNNNNNNKTTSEQTAKNNVSTKRATITSSKLLCEESSFLTTSRLLRLFSAGMKAPKNGDRIVYMDGAWDMFHCGHVSILKEAKQRGHYLIVGVHGDAVVNRVRGTNLPLMNLHERVLSVMGCRYVDDVLIDAPYCVTPQIIASLNIAEVVHGSETDDIGTNFHDEGDRYKYPREAGIFKVIQSPSSFNLGCIVERIQINQETFQTKISRKKKIESEYYDQKYIRSSTNKQ